MLNSLAMHGSGAAFIGIASFKSTFYGLAGFKDAIFNKEASFVDAIFTANPHSAAVASFRAATFADSANFSNTTFNSHATFENATFGAKVDFDSVKFVKDANFSCSANTLKAAEGCGLRADAFEDASFKHAIFGGRAVFTNRQFIRPADFFAASFEQAPEFYGCRLHEGMTFTSCDFMDKGQKHASRAASAYRALKLAMESLRDRQSEARFFVLEQQAMRKVPMTPRHVRLMSVLYAFFSNYGESILRPLGWLTGTTALSFILYAYLQYGVIPTDICHMPWDTFKDAIRAALEPVLNPFGAFTFDKPNTYRFLVSVLMVVQSVFSLIWIALFLLAVRRRFKLD